MLFSYTKYKVIFWNKLDCVFLQLESPRLFIMSRKAPYPEGFVEHASNLNTIDNKPFYALWKRGEIEKTYFSQKESQSLVNFKKGIVSLFQVIIFIKIIFSIMKKIISLSF